MEANTSSTQIPAALRLAVNIEHGRDDASIVDRSNAVELKDTERAGYPSRDGNSSTSKLKSEAVEPEESELDAEQPKGIKFALLYSCILLGAFLTGYVGVTVGHLQDCSANIRRKDTSCIATLAPVITDEFNALNNLGWYAIA